MSHYDGWRDYKGPIVEVGTTDGFGRFTPSAAIKPKRSKYGSVAHCVLPDLRILPANECAAVSGRIRFDSKREAERFIVLRLEQDAGRISDLMIQRRFSLHAVTPEGVRVHVADYVADFSYRRGEELVVEDAKGVRTAVYALKKKIVEAQHGITVVEI